MDCDALNISKSRTLMFSNFMHDSCQLIKVNAVCWQMLWPETMTFIPAMKLVGGFKKSADPINILIRHPNGEVDRIS